MSCFRNEPVYLKKTFLLKIIDLACLLNLPSSKMTKQLMESNVSVSVELLLSSVFFPSALSWRRLLLP